jgi:hypothetical protein
LLSLAARTTPLASATVMRSKLRVFIISSTTTSTASQSSPSTSAAFCAAMKRAVDAP